MSEVKDKNIKEKTQKQLQNWQIFLIISVVSFLLTFAIGLAAEKLHLNTESLLFICLILLPTFISFGSFLSFIVCMIRLATGKATSRYTPVHSASGMLKQRRQSVNITALYDSDNLLRYRRTHEPVTWLYVGLSLAVFFPLGIFLAIRKVVEEKARYYENGIRLVIFGVIIMVLDSSFVFLLFSRKIFDPLSILLVLPFAVGLFMFIFGFVFKHKGRLNHDYMTILKIERITHIDNIASIMRTDYDHVSEAVQKLIDNELLKGAYIYHKDKEVIIPNLSKKIACKCKNCGATTVLYTTDKRECMYCGAEI